MAQEACTPVLGSLLVPLIDPNLLQWRRDTAALLQSAEKELRSR